RPMRSWVSPCAVRSRRSRRAETTASTVAHVAQTARTLIRMIGNTLMRSGSAVAGLAPATGTADQPLAGLAPIDRQHPPNPERPPTCGDAARPQGRQLALFSQNSTLRR